MHHWLQATLARTGYVAEQGCEIAVRLVTEEEGRELNRRYRERDSATNVLSFPVGEDAILPDDEPVPLGDLVLCAAVVHSEASAQNKPIADHWGHLLVHGTLHLLGYDHETDAEAAAMERLEIEILAAKGVPNPYVPRVSG